MWRCSLAACVNTGTLAPSQRCHAPMCHVMSGRLSPKRFNPLRCGDVLASFMWPRHAARRQFASATCKSTPSTAVNPVCRAHACDAAQLQPRVFFACARKRRFSSDCSALHCCKATFVVCSFTCERRSRTNAGRGVHFVLPPPPSGNADTTASTSPNHVNEPCQT